MERLSELYLMKKFLLGLTIGLFIGILLSIASIVLADPQPPSDSPRPTLTTEMRLLATETPRPTSTPYPILPTLTPTPYVQKCWCECDCTPPPTPQPQLSFPLSGKGLAGPLHIDDVLSVGATWRYNWNPIISDMEGVYDIPMIRDVEQLDKLLSGEWTIGGDVKIILGFNEPDLESQANITYEEFPALWRSIEELYPESDGWILCSPAPSPNHYTWLFDAITQYQNVYGEMPRIDCIAVHPYIWEVETSTGSYSNITQIVNMIETFVYQCESWNKFYGMCKYGIIYTESAAGAFRTGPGQYDYTNAIYAYDRFLNYPMEISTYTGTVQTTPREIATGIAWYTAHDSIDWGWCPGITTALYGTPCGPEQHYADEPLTPLGEYFLNLDLN